MKPIYFPFTYVSDRAAEAVAACFGQFIVYRPMNDQVPAPMQRRAQQGVLELRVPVTQNEQALTVALKNYLDWAHLHLRGSADKTADLKSRMGGLPYFDDYSSSKILAEVKAKIQGGSTGKITDPTLKARIFLCLAQEFDRQNHEIANELYRFHQENADLLRQLKMEEDSLADELQPVPLPDPFTDFMVSDRLEAWTRIYRRDPEAPGLFVTHSRAVMAHLLEKSTTAVKVMHSESIPLDIGKSAAGKSWQQKLALNLAAWVENEQPPEAAELPEYMEFPVAEATVSLQVYLVPHQIPREFFAGCSELNDAEPSDQTGKFKHTLIALIERRAEKMLRRLDSHF